MEMRTQTGIFIPPCRTGCSIPLSDFLLSDPQQVRAVGDAKYKKVLEDAEGAALASGEEVLRRVSIQDDDWNQLYVYMRITGATCGFVVVPFWNLNGPKYEWFPDRFHFHKSPCDSNVHLAVLALNLLQPLTEVKREAAKQLRSWLASSKEG